MKKVIILDCGPSLEEVSQEFGQSPEWIMSALEDQGCEFDLIKAYEGQTVENSGDAWIITGSPRSVYDEEDWMLRLEANIRDAASCKRPVLGICFGHHLIAKSCGGKVEKNPLGWELGSYSISLTEHGKYSPLFKDMQNEFMKPDIRLVHVIFEIFCCKANTTLFVDLMRCFQTRIFFL